MLKNKVFLEHKSNERVYQFLCDSESPLGELLDAVSAMKVYIINMIVEEEKKSQKKEEQVEDGNK